MSVHGPEPGRAKPWKATWRDGRQRAWRFESEDQARAFDALPAAAKTALAEATTITMSALAPARSRRREPSQNHDDSVPLRWVWRWCRLAGAFAHCDRQRVSSLGGPSLRNSSVAIVVQGAPAAESKQQASMPQRGADRSGPLRRGRTPPSARPRARQQADLRALSGSQFPRHRSRGVCWRNGRSARLGGAVDRCAERA